MIFKILKPLTILLSMLPLGPEILRLIPVWKNSPMDRYDFLYLVTGAVLLLFLLLLHAGKEADKRDYKAIPFLLGSFAVFSYGIYASLNLFYFCGVVGFSFCLVWLFYGWRLFWRILPAGGLLILSIPTSAIAMFPPMIWNWVILKCCFGSLLLLFAVTAEFLNLCPNWRHGIFYITLIAFLNLSLADNHQLPSGETMYLNTNRMNFQDYIGSKQELSDFDKRFFAGNRRTERTVFFAKNGDFISLLSFDSGSSVHNLHPPSVCLLSAGWELEKVIPRRTVVNGRYFAFEEILAVSGGKRFLFYAWYSNDEISTGSYLRFRSLWHPSDTWRVYQVMTPILTTREAAEKILNNFVSAMSKNSGGKHLKRKKPDGKTD
ncbi:MAG: hypothetical protein BWY31_00805 [Lentisphaerae bacterium ADurb.Bin242]|nr:MAG: hypothetical protein BWY31_00805 [Lentisphaerae bacterium ADurb.Bin242]